MGPSIAARTSSTVGGPEHSTAVDLCSGQLGAGSMGGRMRWLDRSRGASTESGGADPAEVVIGLQHCSTEESGRDLKQLWCTGGRCRKIHKVSIAGFPSPVATNDIGEGGAEDERVAEFEEEEQDQARCDSKHQISRECQGV